ncbi:uncharacterized protein [Salmo salar]|uniref:Uncharacterized protein LOC106569078 n=1 Tax=Salmo salar TaxID=8030 RepID=A0A1S3LXF0_SALSA|nr:uncharacterized protein LOC106569078 [Salmo salar]XP_013995535.1 uncharacterized protein LOC106569078 [Salmo salar]XP_013995536.1 uncharacterized protein LOC106569078 [Salmo salar]XP_045550050.1 uncharacterized protein LOC106569078 [Salmo salar]|eukprot:XP_013995530.1 PREDICTED: uncharacterized protein LOC106569078 [Salmo salar]
MTPSHRVDTLTDALYYGVRENQATAIQLCQQKVLKEETEAKEALLGLLDSIPGSTLSNMEVWTRKIKETLTDKRMLSLTWQERRGNSGRATSSRMHKLLLCSSRKVRWTSERIKKQINSYNGRNKSPQFPLRLEYMDVLQQDHPVWSQVSKHLGDRLLWAKQHAVMLHKVLNDILTAIAKRLYCAANFIDLAKAFDSVNHRILIGRLNSLGFSNDCLAWFTNYLSDRVQCVKSEGLLSGPLAVSMGYHRVKFSGRLFSLYISTMLLFLRVII